MNTALPPLKIQTSLYPNDTYSVQREHGPQGPSRHVRLARVTPTGGGLIAKSEEGSLCAVTGKESLRIIRVSAPSHGGRAEYKSATGKGGYRVDASRNCWDTSGLKMESASTDIAWAHGTYSNKVLTSARNGDLIIWDVHKSNAPKYERRVREGNRCINRMVMTPHANYYCMTGASDGLVRVWDLRELQKSVLRINHPSQASIRSLCFSPIPWIPVQVMVGYDNGAIHRWDLRMGQRGQIDKLPLAHSSPVTSLDWYCGDPSPTGSVTVPGPLGWLASSGLDKCIKVWDLTTDHNGHISHKPIYTMRTDFPVRRISWRPGHECELAVVSNVDYSTHSLDAPVNPNKPLTRIISGPSLDDMVKTYDEKASSLLTTSGDAVEIWDVRRSWIGKWRVTGSASEGGATDAVFGDAHSLWTQHQSGTFSQLDLRNVTKPIDSVPRVASTWEVNGSMAFVTDDPEPYEAPYDDLRSDPHASGDSRQSKALGDPPVKITTQAIGTYTNDFASSDAEMFKVLAKRYIFEGRERPEICVYNAGVATSAGHDTASQAWLLLGTCLAQYVPPPSQQNLPSKTRKIPSPLFQPSSSSQPSATSGYMFPSSSTMDTPSDAGKGNSNQHSPTSRRSASISASRMASYSQRLTPTSSTASSPRHLPIPLPSTTPRFGSFYGRRDSVDASPIGSGSSSLLTRRSSMPVTMLQAMSPSERSMKHAGEGVLDDSDSGDSDFIGDGEDEEGDDTAGVNSSDEDAFNGLPGMNLSRPLPLSTPLSTPSPLSRLVERQAWTSDDSGETPDSDADGSEHGHLDGDGLNSDASTPSPQSTDSDSIHGGTMQGRRARSSTNSSIAARPRRWTRSKRRSRSSTIASLPAPLAVPSRPLLTHQDSLSSIRTVMAAGGESVPKNSNAIHEGRESTAEIDTAVRHQSVSGLSMWPKSYTRSELMANGTAKAVSLASKGGTELAGRQASSERNQVTERRIESIRIEDRRFRESTITVLKSALEEFADEGDVQMCAMLSLVAGSELGIPASRSTRFIESYIELLNRMRLYTCSAYVRKYSQDEGIRKPTLIGTTIYSTCAKCRRPLLRPAGQVNGGLASKGGFGYCQTCKQSRATCSICRLPVRALLFQCSICNHGGHQECYRQYYFQHPMVDLPTVLPPRGRASMRLSPSSEEEVELGSGLPSGQGNNLGDSVYQADTMSTSSMQSTADTLATQSPTSTARKKLAGHPCATGCGHYCWAANMAEDNSPDFA